VAADTSSERSARTRTRTANERIERAAAAIDAADAFPFLCECPDPECVQMIRLTLDQYARVREHPAGSSSRRGTSARTERSLSNAAMGTTSS
jgi:hypothetical protein